MSSWNRHYVAQAKRRENYPFSFELEQLTETPENFTTLDFVVKKNSDITQTIKDHLMVVFDFHKYLDEFSEYNIVRYPENSPEYFIEVTIYNEERTPQGTTKTGLKRKDKIELFEVNKMYVRVYNFKSKYNFTLITSLNHLESVLNEVNIITYDAETSGLDAEFDTIAGINFAKEPGKGYYFAVNHDKQFKQFNLGEKALDIFYKALMKAEKVYLFNARFDIRMLEYYKYDLDETKTNITNKKYDLRNMKFIDTQISTYFADPEWRDHSLKWAEKHFLGYYRPTLEETLKAQRIKSFNTRLIDPRKLLFYAAQDAISTYELGVMTEKYVDEFGLAGQIDMQIIYPLMDSENRLIRIDVDYLNQELKKIRERLTQIETKIKKSIGFDINLNSAKQKIALFESFNLDTGERTQSGAMSTGREAVDKMIERLENQGKEYPDWLKYLGEQSKLQQMESTFFGNLAEQVEYRDGRVRLNYRHGITSTGRFSSGQES